jgi:hypothetical protein
MSGTANLAIPFITAAQNQKEVTHSTGMSLLDAALTETLAVSVAAGNAAPTQAQVRAASRLQISGASVAGRVVTWPAVRRPFYATLDAASTHPVTLRRGTTDISLLPGCTLHLYSDATANSLFRLAEFGPFRASQWVRGAPDASEVIWAGRFAEPMTLLPDLLGWDVQSLVAADASSAWSVRVAGTPVGSITWGAAATVPVLATSGGAAVAVPTNNLVDVVAAASPDATLSDITASFLFVRG